MSFIVIIIFFLPYMGMTVDGAWPFEQTLNAVSTDVKFGRNWPSGFGRVVYNMILYMYTAQEQGKVTLHNKILIAA